MPVSEYIVKQKNEGAVILKKAAAIVGYVLLTVILAVLVISFAPALLLIPFLLISAAFVALVAFITWKFLCIEYEIVIGNGELCASVIYGRSFTRRLLRIDIGDLSEIGEYNDMAYARLCDMSLQKNTVCVSSLSAPVVYYAIYDDGKDRCVLYFETDERGISILRRHNLSAFKIR